MTRSATPDDMGTGYRRAPYGDNPELGRNGSQARRELISAARELFGSQGYHATTAEAISQATGRSSSAFYQYFEDKRDVFRLLVDELGADLIRHARTCPEFGPSRSSYLALRDWVGQLSAIQHKHAPAFVEWPVTESTEHSLGVTTARFSEHFADILLPRIEPAEARGAEARTVAFALLGMASWTQHTYVLRHGRIPDAARKAVLDETVCRVFQLALFPESGFYLGRDAAPSAEPAYPARPEILRARESDLPGLRRPATERARPTIDRLLEGATRAFERSGFRGTSANKILAEAGAAHGSLYTYWADRGAVFTTLAFRASWALADQLEQLPAHLGDGTRLRAWLRGWLNLLERHGAIMRVWTTELTDEPGLAELSAGTRQYFDQMTAACVARSCVLAGMGTDATATALWALLTAFPYWSWLQMGGIGRDSVLAAQALLFRHGFLA